jgi:MYXO-CTERM domain-containing protein
MMVVTTDDTATHETFSTNAPPVPPSVPERGTLGLLAAALLSFGALRRRRVA